jgi:hypothetical protein
LARESFDKVADDGVEHVVVHVGRPDRLSERKVAQVASDRFRSVRVRRGKAEIGAIMTVYTATAV